LNHNIYYVDYYVTYLHTGIVESNYDEIYAQISYYYYYYYYYQPLIIVASFFFDIKKHNFLVKYSIKWTVTSKQIFAFAFVFFFQIFNIHFWQKKQIPRK
jgi:hypothetical protein